MSEFGGYLFLDLETGGFDENKDAIVQVAAIRTDMELNLRASLRSYIRPPANLEIGEKSIEVHGLTRESLIHEPDELAVGRMLREFISGGDRLKFAGFNCQFDLRFLEAWKERALGQEWGFRTPWLCVMKKVQDKHGLKKFPKLSEAAELTGVKLSSAHDAAADIMATLQIARKLHLA